MSKSINPGLNNLPPDTMSEVQAILFDLDGTLYRKTCLELIVGFGGLRSMRTFAAIAAARKTKAGEDLGTRDALIDAIALDAALRLGEDPARIRLFYEEVLYGRFMRRLSLFYRARPCFSRLFSLAGTHEERTRGPLLAILSDYGHVDDRLQAIGIDPRVFTHRFSCEDAGALKPAPRPFSEAAEVLGVEPQKILVVGDRDDTDGAGAIAAGMNFAKINGRPDARRIAGALRDLIVS